MKLYGGVEAGGTKFVCAVATSPDKPPVATLVVPTTTPTETLGKVIAFFKQHDLKALGIASFGPLDLRRDSKTYGQITATPKPGWKNTALTELFERTFGVPVGFDTDVNASALAEVCYGAAQGLNNVGYFTVGTGIGGGLIMNGQTVHGLVHPEMGHVPVPRHPNDSYRGSCVFHGDCLEGMASGPAIEARWKRPARGLPREHEAWEFEAYYLARAVCMMVYAVSPQRIVMGGGVMKNRQLYPMIQRQVPEMLHGYVQSPSIIRYIQKFIAEPGLGDQSGVVGALELARRAATDYG
jgi:fructokinase